MSLSPEQRAAVQSDAPRTIVQAGAGAGKTRVLVARYLELVANLGIPPDAILTITYTHRAAAEMKRRIVDALREAGRSEDAQVAETGPIQTLHSFCDRVLREYALEAGVDPDFELLSKADLPAWRSEAMVTALGHLEHDPLVKDLVNVLAGEATGSRELGENRLKNRLQNLVEATLEHWRTAGLEPEPIAANYADPEQTLAFVAGVIAAVEQIPAPGPTVGGNLRNWVMTERKAQGRPASGLTSVEDESISARWLTGLVRLSLAVWAEIETRMDAEQRFDFARMERKAVRLLETSDAARERIRRRFRAVLVDEAQDLNPVQYRLLNALNSPYELVVGDPQQSIFGFRLAQRGQFVRRGVEGERHQLTVNHRSTPGILRAVQHVFQRLWGEDYAVMVPPPPPEASDTAPTAEIDPDDPFATPSAHRDYEGLEWWSGGASQEAARIAEGVRELIQEGNAPGDIAILARYGYVLQDIGTELTRRGLPFRMIRGSEQFYLRLEVRDLANALSALADPTDDLALLALLRSPAVGLSLDAITGLALAAPVGTALADFVSPLAEDAPRLTELREWWGPLAAQADRLAAWEVLGQFLNRSRYLEKLARRAYGVPAVANVRKLLEMATSQPEVGPRAFSESLRMLSRLAHKEEDASPFDADADLVSLLTIHTAKGLEWPIVVLANLGQPYERKRQANRTEVEFDYATGLLTANISPGVRSFTHEWWREQRQAADAIEEQRVLYVAMTRAQRRLCLVMPDQANRGMPAHDIQQGIGRKADAAMRISAVRDLTPPTPPADGLSSST